MKNLFKSITVINGEVYAEYNRELTIEDFTITHETDVIVVNHEASKGKMLTKYATHKINPIVREELIDYFNKLILTGKFDGVIGQEVPLVKMLSEFEIRVEKVIDFRGCRTGENRQEKIDKSIKEVIAEHAHTTESVLPSKVEAIHNRLDVTVNYHNQMFSSYIIKLLTNEGSYSKYFDTEQINTLEDNYQKLSLAISTALYQRKKVTKQLADIKREIAFNKLKEYDWKIIDESKESISIPEPVAKDAKKAIDESFVKLQSFNIQ